MKDIERTEELNRLLKARLEEWRLQNNDPGYKRTPVITVTREPGCGAEAIAQKLCAELGMHLYDWELVEKVAKDEKVSAQLVSSLEANPPTGFADFLAQCTPGYGLTSQAYVASVKRVLLAILVPGNAIIVGRGSNFLLPADEKIGLCLVAPLAVRIKNLMKERGLTEKEARKHISKVEVEHRKLVKKYCQADVREPDHYHLVINTALVKPDTVVQLVKTMIQTEKESSHDPSGH